MTIENVLCISLVVLIVLIEILVFMVILTKCILIPYKRKTANMDINELYQALEIFVTNEINQIVTNQNYDNFYKDLCIRITESLSDDFYNRFAYYMNKENLVKLICRMVSVYLQKKIE